MKTLTTIAAALFCASCTGCGSAGYGDHYAVFTPPELAVEVVAAAADWRLKSGIDLEVYVATCPQANESICVQSFDAETVSCDGLGPGGVAYGCTQRAAHADIAYVNIALRVPIETLPYMLRHEIGHALGLAHVDNTACIMYPVIEGRFDQPVSCLDASRAAAIRSLEAPCH